MTETYLEEDHGGRVTKLESNLEMANYRLETQQKLLERVSVSLEQLVLVSSEQNNQSKEIRKLVHEMDRSKALANKLIGFGTALSLILCIVGWIAMSNINKIDTNTLALQHIQTEVSVLEEKIGQHMHTNQDSIQ